MLVQVLLYVLTLVALLVAIVGTTESGTSVSPILSAVENAVGPVQRVASTIAAASTAFSARVSGTQLFTQMLQSDVVPALRNDTNGTFALATHVLDDVQTYSTLVAEVACFIPSGLLGLNALTWGLCFLGEGVAISGLLLLISGVVRSKRPIMAAGFVCVAVGMAFMLISFTISTPASIYVDDGCFTAHSIVRTSKLGAFLLSCPAQQRVYQSVVSLLNVTSFFIIHGVQPDVAALAAVDPRNNFPPPMPTVSFDLTLPTTTRLLQAAQPQLAPLLAYLETGLKKSIGAPTQQLLQVSADTVIIFSVSALISVGQMLFLSQSIFAHSVMWVQALLWIGECDSFFFVRWINTINNLVCVSMPDGLGMIVWGTFVAFFTLFLAVLLLFIGSPLMSAGSVPAISLAVHVLLALSAALSFIVAILINASRAYASSVDSLAVFIFDAVVCTLALGALTLPTSVWTPLARRVMWGLLALLALALTIVNGVLLGNAVAFLQTCNTTGCLFSCSIVAMVRSMFASIASGVMVVTGLVLMGAAAYFVLGRIDEVKVPFTGKLEVDFETHAVELKPRTNVDEMK